MDPAMVTLFRQRMGVTDPIPPLKPAASGPERKKRRLVKAAEKEGTAPAIHGQTALTLRPPKPPSVPEPQGKGKEREKEKTKIQAPDQGRGALPPSAPRSQGPRASSGVAPGHAEGVGVAPQVSGKRPFEVANDALDLYLPLVPPSDYEKFTCLSGEALVKEVCHIDAQAHTIAVASAKKALALEVSLRESQAALKQKGKDAEANQAKAAAELKEARAKIDALEKEASQVRALKEKNAALAQVVDDLKHQVSIKNEALKKAVEAAKQAEERSVRAQEALQAEGEKAVAAFISSSAYESALDRAVEDFKTSLAGEHFLLDGIQKWQEGDDGKFLKIYNFNLGFEDFRKAAKNRFPELDLSEVRLEDLFTAPAETVTAAETTALEGDEEGGEEVSKPDEVVAAFPVIEAIPTPNVPTPSAGQVPDMSPSAPDEVASSAPEVHEQALVASPPALPVPEQTAPTQS